MKLLWSFSFLYLFSFDCRSQLSGTISIPSSGYPSLQSALSALNTQSTSAGGLTIQIAAGYSESVPNGGYSLSVSGTSLHPLVIERSGNGNQPVFIGYTGNSTPGSSVQDGLFRLIGCDHVILSGLSFRDPNINNPQTMEFGLGFFKSSPTNGCQYNVIKNCEIILSTNNNANGAAPAADGSRGIEFVNALATAHSTSVLVTSQAGAHAYNKIHSNAISQSNHAIVMTGFADQSPYMFADRGNEIGGNTAAEGNYVFNFGGGGTGNASSAIKTTAQYDLICGYNRIKNNDGNNTGHLTTLRGIQVGAAPGANTSIHHNTITLTPGSTNSQMTAIENSAGASGTTNTVAISYNTIFQCHHAEAVSGNFYGISHNGSAAQVTINYNRFRENSSTAISGSNFLISCNGTLPSTLEIKHNELGFYFNGSAPFTGNTYGIYLSGITSSATAVVAENHFQDFTFKQTASSTLYFIYNTADFSHLSMNANRWRRLTLRTSGHQYYIYNSSSTADALSVCDNSVSAVHRSAGTGNTVFYYGNATSPANAVQTFTGNYLSEMSCAPGNTGNFYGFYNTEGNVSPYPKKTFSANSILDIQFPTSGLVYGFYLSDLGDGGSGSASGIFSNTLQAIRGADNVYGIYAVSPVSPNFPVQFAANHVGGIGSSGVSASAYGIYVSGNNAGVEIFRNKVFDMNTTGNNSTAYGLYLAAINSATVHNNLVGRIESSGVGNSKVNGMYISASGNYFVHYNSIYLDASSNATHFGSNALYASTTASLTLRNNVFINLSVQTGTGVCAAYRRSSTNLASYQNSSDNNLLYAGSASSNRVLMYNGSTGYQTLSSYKTVVSPRDLATLSNTLLVQSMIGSSAHFLHLTPSVANSAESGGSVITPLNFDADLNIRQGSTGYTGTGSKPDIGADEIETNYSPCNTLIPSVITPSFTVCAGRSFTAQATTVSAGSGIGLQWQSAASPGGTYTDITTGTGFNGLELTPLPLALPGNYYYRLQNTCATNSLLSVSNIMTVVVQSVPVVTIIATPTTVCVNDTLKMLALGNGTIQFEWWGPEGYYENNAQLKRSELSTLKGGTYSLIASDAGCSAAIQTVQIHVGDPGLKVFSTHDDLCVGGAATLFATSSSVSYTWNTTATTTSIVVSPSVATWYTVGVTDTLNCFSKKSLLLGVIHSTIQGLSTVACGIPGSSTLSVKAFSPSLVSWYSSPTSAAGLLNGLNYPVTASTNTVLYAQANSTSFGTLSVAPNGSLATPGIMFDLVALSKLHLTSLDVFFSAAGTASFEIWGRTGTHMGANNSSSGWNLVNSGTVNVNSPGQLASLSMGTGFSVLTGQDAALYVLTTSSNTILHGPGNLAGSSLAQNKELKIKEGSVGTYFNCTLSPSSFYGSIRYSIPGCISARVPVTMTVSALPQLTVSSNVPDVCPGKSVTLTALGAATYSWSGVGSGSVVSAPVLAGRIFSVTGTNAFGCKSSSTVQVNTLAAPVITVSPVSATVCPLQPFLFSASGADTYTWNTGPNGQTITVTPVSSGTYSVQGTNSLGCVSLNTVAVTTLTTPLISISGTTDTICPGEAVQLSALGGLTYTWLPGGANNNTVHVNPMITSAYNVIGLGVNGCTNVAFAVIHVEDCVSLTEQKISSFMLFPNPTSGQIIIKTPGELTAMQVLDGLGQVVLEARGIYGLHELDLSLFPAGIYILRIKVNEVWCTEKVIRQ